nr:MAG TPA: Glutathione-dependent formaldehyde-activating enzyme [Caudoviricetes sp.]
MIRTKVTHGFCIQCGAKFVSEWIDINTVGSYYLSSFDDVHVFDTFDQAKHVSNKFENSEIKRIKLITSITKELE